MTMLPEGSSGHPGIPLIREMFRIAFRWTPHELDVLGRLRGTSARHADPRDAPGTPPAIKSHVEEVLQRIDYVYRHSGSLTARQQAGVQATQDALFAAYLQPWLPAAKVSLLLTPARQMIGPVEHHGYGIRHREVALLLLQANGFSETETARVAAKVREMTPTQRGLISNRLEAAGLCVGRMSSLLLASDALELLLGSDDDNVDVFYAWQAGCWATAAVILADVLDPITASLASDPWNAARDPNT